MIRRDEAMMERGNLATESALAYRLRHDVVEPMANRIIDTADADALRRVAAYLRDRELITRQASDDLSELLGLEHLRK